jgi:hypothetical protein
MNNDKEEKWVYRIYFSSMTILLIYCFIMVIYTSFK